MSYQYAFLSTPSVRRATCKEMDSSRLDPDFYPRPPCGGRPCGSLSMCTIFPIFLSTPSVRRATFPIAGSKTASRISIHALRAEGDPSFINN